MKYGLLKETNYEFEEAIKKLEEELKKEGFGILMRIDFDEKFKAKLGIDFKKYTILGTCNPKNAHKAILIEENVGLFLPCNVIVYEKGGKTAIAVIKPTTAMESTNNEKLFEIAKEIENALIRVVSNL
ncbi:MAG: ABC transporter ATP-binding protein [Marinitoga sp. 4572_148]|nr:MAG: ABC transporter ATP-binding protein [Marinitoga sp. 4572_148]